ncbi:MAG TPA: hypothetical protein VHV10_00875 [Ktedonobacteraceae bacterium]|nr:hypothetical protein [Ktedonobacteraceae bacterium]
MGEKNVDYQGEITLVTAVIRTPVAFIPSQVANLETHLSPPASGFLNFHVRSVITVETTPQGTVSPTSPASP